MKNRSLFIVVLVLVLALALVGCSKKEKQSETASVPSTTFTAPTEGYSDGIYYAIGDTFDSDWKDVVTIVVADGSIVSADWNAVSINAGLDKKAYDRAGKYNMVKFGNAIAEWYEQAEKVEAYLISTQDPSKVRYTDAAGSVDDIAGVSIHVKGFFDLAAKALAAKPVGKGPYADGAYYASDDQFHNGWKENVSLTVINGYIAAANWSAVNENGEDKKAYDKAGNYNMVKFGGAIDEWYVQAGRVEEYLLKTQDPKAVSYTNADGNSDDISGATITVKEFFNLVEKALAAGPQ